MKDCFKKALAIAVAAWTLLSVAMAEVTQDDVAYWLEETRYLVEDIGCRVVDSDGELEAMAYMCDCFESYGYHQASGTLDEIWVFDGSDYIAKKKAQQENAEIIIVCAHYDTASTTAGAKDNASGVAAMLTLMRLITPLEPFCDTEIWFLATTSEEQRNLGSALFVEGLTEEERQRVLAVYNIDILAVDRGATNIALSCNTQGMRTDGGYVNGTGNAPAHNKASRAFEKALWEVGGFKPEERGATFCVPRNVGMGDHVPFHEAGIDAACVCFEGNVAAGGAWPAEMHTWEDGMKDFDLDRTRNALNILYTAITSLAADHRYGD